MRYVVEQLLRGQRVDVLADALRETRLFELLDQRCGELGRGLGIFELALGLERFDCRVERVERLRGLMRELPGRDLDVEIVELTGLRADRSELVERLLVDL